MRLITIYRKQVGALCQAQEEQREALSLAKAVIEQQISSQRPPTAVYIPSSCKVAVFSGFPAKAGAVTVEEWIASIRAALRTWCIPEEHQVDTVG